MFTANGITTTHAPPPGSCLPLQLDRTVARNNAMNPGRRMRRAAEKRAWAQKRTQERKAPQELGNAYNDEVGDETYFAQLRQDLNEFRETTLARRDARAGVSRTAPHQPAPTSFTEARAAAMNEPCPTCGASPGEGCSGKSGKSLYDLHAARKRAVGL